MTNLVAVPFEGCTWGSQASAQTLDAEPQPTEARTFICFLGSLLPKLLSGTLL